MRYIVVLMVVVASCANAQDIIILKNNSDTIFCSIVKDKITSIDYRLPGDSTIYSIKTIETEGYLIGEYELSEDEQEQYNKSFAEAEIESINATKYNAGFYLSFDDFLNDSPSIQGEIIKEKKKFRRLTNRTFNLFVKDSLGNLIEYKNEYWGYSDGKNSFFEEIIRKKQIFHTIRSVDGYFIYNKVIKRRIPVPVIIPGPLMYSSGGIRFITWNDWTIRMFDLDSGKPYKLNAKTLSLFNVEKAHPLWEELEIFDSMSHKDKHDFANQYYYNP